MRPLYPLDGICLSLALLTAAAAGQATPRAAGIAGHWPQWRGPARDGVSTDTGLLSTWPAAGPARVWSTMGLGAGFSSVSVAGGRIFTMGDRHDGQYAVAVDESTGQIVWATRVGERHDDSYGGPRSTPAVDVGALFLVTTDGDVVSLDAATGRERWRRSLTRDFGGRMMSSWRFSESPLVDGDRVIVTPGGSRAALVALDKRTGADVWRATVPRIGTKGADGAGYASAIIVTGGGVRQYVQLLGRGLVGVRAADGQFLWGYNRVANDVANIPTAVASGDLVFASSGYDSGGAAILQLRSDGKGGVTATERRFFNPRELQNHHGGVVLIGGVVYGGHGHNNGFPFALELATGRLLWDRVRGPGSGSAAVTAAEGLLYFRYQDGTMALIEANPTTYRLRSSFTIPNVRQPSWSHPVVTGGRLYLREQDALHAYAISR